jgi:CheY-like chemotaxis protein
MARILVIDDDPGVLAVTRIYVETAGHECISADGWEQTLQILRHVQPDLVITDVMMPGPGGSEVYDHLRARFGPGLPVIISTGTNLKIRDADDPLVALCPKKETCDDLMATVAAMLEKVGKG